MASTVTPIETKYPYGATPRGFQGKNIFADTAALAAGARVVFDVGTHRGEEAATYRSLFPDATVHCFEPTLENVEWLREAFGDEPAVHIHALALSDFEGEASFFCNPADATNSLLPFESRASAVMAAEHLETTKTIKVKCTTLDAAAERFGVDVIDLLKLDVQGAERRVLEGGANLLRDKRVRVICAEVTFVPVYKDQTDASELMVWLRQQGYRLYDFYNFAYAESSGQLLWGDAIFLPEPAAEP